ncbi:hypothetical protein SAMN05443639_11423 [Stigmatella erecta]|uniref:Uncharacterized protein n=1 Tax=Stigmatella erecta TaxID=83460 RepID=A0A1I0KT79_9BACT|nr:hypothetical protein SAMN05443639_11423 [Stigmatella erecta]
MLGPAALAETLDILGPSEAVPPEGFSVALVLRDAAGIPGALSSPTLVAEEAEVRPEPAPPPLRSYRILPKPGARSVALRARAGPLHAQAQYVIGPPASRVELALEPAAPVKGRDTEATLTVRMLRPDGSPEDSGAPPVVRASVGRVEELSRSGPGTYRARYLLPKTNYPEVAILVALSSWPHPQSIHGAFGRVVVPLAASVNLPGETEPEASISIVIAGVKYGPVQAARDGSFRVPVVVPPGHRLGQGLIVDPAGNVQRRAIDLGLPQTDGLACVLNPQRLPADGSARARILCAASDPMGKPAPDARATAKARYGTLDGPRRAEGGLLEWLYTAPRHRPSEPERIQASWLRGGLNSQEEMTLQLVQGPAERLTLSLGAPQVYLGAEVPVALAVADGSGQPRPGAQVLLGAPLGTLSPPREETPGTFQATWTLPPEGPLGEVPVTVRAWGPAGSEPARLSAWMSGGALHLGVSDLAGLPIPQQPLSVGGQPWQTGEDGTVSVGAVSPGTLEVGHGVWPGLHKTLHVLAQGGPVYPEDPPLVPVPVVRQVLIQPAIPVLVQIQVEGARVTYWVEDLKGQVLPGRAVHVALSSGQASAPEEREGRTRFTLAGAQGTPVSVSVADVATGVTALAEVKP